MLAILSSKYHKIWMLLHFWGCGAEQGLTQSHPSSVVPVSAGLMWWAEPGVGNRVHWQPSNTPRHGAGPEIIQGNHPVAEWHGARERVEDFSPMALLGQGLNPGLLGAECLLSLPTNSGMVMQKYGLSSLGELVWGRFSPHIPSQVSLHCRYSWKIIINIHQRNCFILRCIITCCKDM